MKPEAIVVEMLLFSVLEKKVNFFCRQLIDNWYW